MIPKVDYVEFPTDVITKIEFPKPPPPDGGGGDPFGYCGMFMLGLVGGIQTGYSGVYTLDPGQLYMTIEDLNPGHDPNKPWMYYPIFLDYALEPPDGLGIFWPYVWSGPSSFTLTRYARTDAAPLGATRYLICRNVNPQRWREALESPDEIINGTVANVPGIQLGENYPPFFVAEHYNEEAGYWYTDEYPRIDVQAYCEFTTEGALPPQPPGWDEVPVYFQYPIAGGLDEPVRPAPPAPGASRARRGVDAGFFERLAHDFDPAVAPPADDLLQRVRPR